ncbi:MAG: diaminopimelate decarboxylase, partial [Nocardiopsis sp. BM-2018]
MSPLPLHLLPDNATVDADGDLSIAGCRIADLAELYGTPLFVYDEDHIRARCREAVAAFGAERVVYATKAFLCRAMARLAHEEQMLLDVATGGELFVAMAAGVPASSCMLHGNNKSVGELRQAIEAGVRAIVVDSFDELDRLEAIHADGVRAGGAGPEGDGSVPEVLIRVTPGVHAHTHEFVATGQDDSKFGFNLANGDAAAAVDRARRSPAVELVGVHCHIGSNVFDASSFARAAEVMAG